MSKVITAALAKLLDGEEDTVAASTFTTSQRRALEDLGRKTGAIRIDTVGRGTVFRVLDRDVLSGHLGILRPQRAEDVDPSIPKRAANISQTRSSKCGDHGHANHYLLIKAASDEVIWEDSETLPARRFSLTDTSAIAGAGVLTLSDNDGWRSDKPLWLVENQALFDRLDWLPTGSTGTVAYYAGQLPTRVLRWLSQQKRVPEVILFPDYDGVGLMNYARLRESCASPCSFWLMPGWQARLKAFGSNQVWLNTQQDFQAAIERLQVQGMDNGIEELCWELSKQGLALEHESIWLKPTNGNR